MGLTSRQKKQIYAVYLDLLQKELKISATTQSTFQKRVHVNTLTQAENAKLQRFLSKRQFVMLVAWRENLRHQSRPPR